MLIKQELTCLIYFIKMHQGILVNLSYIFLRWSYTFQSLTFYTKLQQWEKQTADISVPLCISERSIYTDRYIFAPNFYR